MIEQLDACDWLFLRELTEPRDNSLRLIIAEARPYDTPEDIELTGATIRVTRSIEHDESYRVFEVLWDTYIAYSITNESYAHADKPDNYVGRRARRYSRSAFLDYVQRATFASAEYPGPYEHMAIICENHIVNVASTVEPCIALMKSGRPRIVKSAQPGVGARL